MGGSRVRLDVVKNHRLWGGFVPTTPGFENERVLHYAIQTAIFWKCCLSAVFLCYFGTSIKLSTGLETRRWQFYHKWHLLWDNPTNRTFITFQLRKEKWAQIRIYTCNLHVSHIRKYSSIQLHNFLSRIIKRFESIIFSGCWISYRTG